MAIAYNSILNDNWYARLQRGIIEGSNAAVRRTGSEADDPYWKARQGQELGDLSNARQDAFRSLMEQGNAMRGAGYARERAYQQRATWGLKNMNPQAGPATYLGTQAEDMGGPELPAPLQPPNFEAGGPLQAPEAYKAPGSGGYRLPASGGAYRPQATQSAYNPGQFNNPALDRRQKELDKYYARLAKGWR